MWVTERVMVSGGVCRPCMNIPLDYINIPLDHISIPLDHINIRLNHINIPLDHRKIFPCVPYRKQRAEYIVITMGPVQHSGGRATSGC